MTGVWKGGSVPFPRGVWEGLNGEVHLCYAVSPFRCRSIPLPHLDRGNRRSGFSEHSIWCPQSAHLHFFQSCIVQPICMPFPVPGPLTPLATSSQISSLEPINLLSLPKGQARKKKVQEGFSMMKGNPGKVQSSITYFHQFFFEMRGDLDFQKFWF